MGRGFPHDGLVQEAIDTLNNTETKLENTKIRLILAQAGYRAVLSDVNSTISPRLAYIVGYVDQTLAQSDGNVGEAYRQLVELSKTYSSYAK